MTSTWQGEGVRNLDSKLRMVDDRRWGEEGGRRVKYGRPRQIFIFLEKKYEYVFS